MPAITTLTIGGDAIDLAAYPLGTLVAYARDGIPSLSLYRRGGALPGLPDPWLGQPVVLTINGTTYFRGDVVSVSPDYEADGPGWVLAYHCLGLRYRGNLVPLTDENTGLDTAPFNLQPEDPAYLASRAGRSVGQILAAVLTMPTNAANLSGLGLGGYTSLSPPALPADTTADLAALALIPPAPVHVGGEKLIGALDGLLAQWAPNSTLWIDPSTGAFRFLDLRGFAPHTFTLGTDPVRPCPLVRDTTDCFTRVEVRGQPLTEPCDVEPVESGPGRGLRARRPDRRPGQGGVGPGELRAARPGAGPGDVHLREHDHRHGRLGRPDGRLGRRRLGPDRRGPARPPHAGRSGRVGPDAVRHPPGRRQHGAGARRHRRAHARPAAADHELFVLRPVRAPGRRLGRLAQVPGGRPGRGRGAAELL